MNLPLDPNRTVDEAPRQDSRAGGSASADPDKAVPRRLELLEEFGRGGMGDVHRGRDTELGRDVAVKILRQGRQDEGKLALLQPRLHVVRPKELGGRRRQLSKGRRTRPQVRRGIQQPRRRLERPEGSGRGRRLL